MKASIKLDGELMKTLFLQAPSYDGGEMPPPWDTMKRSLRESVEFFLLLRARQA